MTQKRPSVVVLGITCNGLSVVRSLGRHGLNVLAVDYYKERAGLSSKYCRVVLAPANIIDDESPWLDFLIDLASRETEKPVLFPTEDAYVLFIAKNRDTLSQHYIFNIAPDDIVDASVSKLGTYQLAVKCDIPTPWTYLIKSIDDYEQIKDKVTFPCALKPSYAHIWLKNYTHEKLLIIKRPEDLSIRLAELDTLQIEVVLQEIIPGGDNNVYVFPVYVSATGDVIGYANLKKIRQRPVDFGVGAFDISVSNKELTDTALKLIKKSGFTGIASTEYKFDHRDNQYKLIDINPRTCMIGELAIASEVDIPYIYYCDQIGEKHDKLIEPKELGIKWFCFEWDLDSFLEYRRRKQLDLVSWLATLKGKKVYAYYAKDDPKPFFIACNLFLKRGFRAIFRKIGLIKKNQ